MIATLLALIGFAKTDVQSRTPPLVFYIAAFPLAWFSGAVVEGLTFLAEWATFGHLTRFWVSVAFRSFGIIAGILFVHGLIRVVLFGDDHSYGGWIRRIVLSIRTGA